jgi:hypothetical protein
MKLNGLLVASFLSIILAMPAPDTAVDETIVSSDAVEAQGYSEKRDLPKKLFARDRVCRINSSGRVNCRSCPSTSCSAPYYVNGGSSYNFDCRAAGDCVTIGGVTNCWWDKTVSEGCYVSGYYTDSGCTLANLGYC